LPLLVFASSGLLYAHLKDEIVTGFFFKKLFYTCFDDRWSTRIILVELPFKHATVVTITATEAFSSLGKFFDYVVTAFCKAKFKEYKPRLSWVIPPSESGKAFPCLDIHPNTPAYADQ